MKTRIPIYFALIVIALVLASVVACGHPRADKSTVPESAPVARIQNNSGQHVVVYDGAFRVISLAPGETGEGHLLGIGLRSLSVRSVAWVTMTEPFKFEENRGWQLTIGLDGVAAVNLLPR